MSRENKKIKVCVVVISKPYVIIFYRGEFFMKKILVLLLSVSLLVLSCTDSGSDSTTASEPKSKFHVTYKGIKSGSNPVDTTEYSSGDEVILASGDNVDICNSAGTGLLFFKAWSDGTKEYQAGDTYVITADVTFTAEYNDVPCQNGCEDGVCKVRGCDSNQQCSDRTDGKTVCGADGNCVEP